MLAYETVQWRLVCSSTENGMSKLLVEGGRILRSDLSAEPADMLIDGATIVAIEPPGRMVEADAQRVDVSDRLLIPGLVNGHTHGHGGLGKGSVKDRAPLETFLTASGAINGSRTLADKRLSATLTAIELVRKGCTAAFDLYVEYPLPSREGMDAVAEAYAEVGMRAVLAPMMADHTLYDALPRLMDALPEPLRRKAEAMKAQPTAAILSAARDILVHWRHDRGQIRPALGPTIPLHCSADFLRGCRDLARDFDTRIQTHLAESKTQAVLGYTKFGKSLVAHLADLGLLGPALSGAHGIWLEPDDIKRLADTGTAIVHNPMSNLRLGSGVAPAREILSAGGRLGIGTDASNTSDGQNMFEAMRLAAYLSRIASEDPDRWLDAEEAFRAATETSASILGFDKLGKLEPGYLADIVFLRLDHINYVPLRAPALQVVFAENGAAIDGVMIGGRMVLREGELLTLDEAAVRREAEAAAVRLDEANKGAAHDALPFADIVGHFCLAHARQPFSVHRRLPDRR